MISNTIESYDQDAASKHVIRALHAETFVFLASQHIVASIFSDNCYHNDTIINVKSDTWASLASRNNSYSKTSHNSVAHQLI